MTAFVLYCPEQELYEEVGLWLIDNLPFGSFDFQELNALGDQACRETPRFNLRVLVHNESDAVAFKLRFSEELERKATTAELWMAMAELSIARRYFNVSMADYMLKPNVITCNYTPEPANADIFASKQLPHGPSSDKVDRPVSIWSHYGIQFRPLAGDIGSIV